MAWTYSNWATNAPGAARLTALRNHIAEVSAKMSAAMSDGGSSRNIADLERYLELLLKREPAEEKRCKAAAGTLTVFTRGRARALP